MDEGGEGHRGAKRKALLAKLCELIIGAFMSSIENAAAVQRFSGFLLVCWYRRTTLCSVCRAGSCYARIGSILTSLA
jgi:hypothetical protein